MPGRRPALQFIKVGDTHGEKIQIGEIAPPCYVAVVSITAVIEKGMIKLPDNVPWASGTVVRIEAVEDQPTTLWEMLKDFDGMANDLPADLATNLDHYIHGHPRQ